MPPAWSRLRLNHETHVLAAVERIQSDPLKAAFVVDAEDRLIGVVTDGDVRRFLLAGGDVQASVTACMNRAFHAVTTDRLHTEEARQLRLRYSALPVIDHTGRLVDVLVQGSRMNIGEFELGADRVFVIAEIGINHNGSVELAKRLVDAAITAGADAVKFQLRDRDALYRTRTDGHLAEDRGVEYIQDMLDKFDLTIDEHRELREYCRAKNVTYMCTPWDEPSVDVLATFDVAALKLASADLVNPYLITKAASLGKPLILSTGMSFEHEIIRTLELLNSLGVPFALLHCNSTYPAPEADIQLGYIKRLQELHNLIGYSGHERGTAVTMGAVALGAKIVERHITLDRSMEGPDHLASLEPDDFTDLVRGIRQLEQALPWHGPGRHASQGELLNRENLGKSVIAAVDIERGTTFSEEMFRIASPGQGLAPYKLPELLGKPAGRHIPMGAFLFESDLNEVPPAAKLHFKMPIPWGIPVRYHDFLDFRKRIEPDLYEFHLSYRDMTVKPAPFMAEVSCERLVVHSPELFENSELMDLATSDESHRRRSIDYLKRVVAVTEELAEWFPNATDRLIVANVGGISVDAPAPQDAPRLYDTYWESYSKIDFGSTELIPQCLPPFPWYLGGQQYLNIFVDPDDLVSQAQEHGIRYTIDLSHLSMACSHLELDFQEALAKVLPYAAHLHVSDAAGTKGEGVDMGTGDIDWPATWAQLQRYPKVSFIPEIWQGHKDHGAGFWSALEFLQELGECS